MNWRLKSVAFRVLSGVPFGGEMHFFAQRHIARSFPRPRARLDALWNKAHSFVEEFARHAGRRALADATFVEIGAGRDLAVPIALRLAGVGRVWSVDVSRLARLELVRHAAQHMTARADVPQIPLDGWEQLEAFGVHYRAPAHLSSIDLQPGTVDCLCSNEVLEHLRVVDLQDLAVASRRLLRDDGIAVHTIDYSDHYARSDRHIDRFNFLTFDDAAWSRHNSSFQYVNRLRHSDYVRILTDGGLCVLAETLTPGVPTTTTTERVAPRFRAYSAADLFGLHGRLVLGRRAPA